MPIIVNVPAPLRNLTNGEHKINANGENMLSRVLLASLFILAGLSVNTSADKVCV